MAASTLSSGCCSLPLAFATHETERRGPVTCHLYDGQPPFLQIQPAIEARRFWMNNITFHLTGCGNDVPEGFSMQGLSNNRTVKK